MRVDVHIEGAHKFLRVALAYYRVPLRYPSFSDGQRDLPAAINSLLFTAVSDGLSDERIAASADALGCTAEELLEAVRFFIRQVLFTKSASHYRVLGLARDAGASQIKNHYRLLIRLFHPDRAQADDEWCDLYAPRINEAYNVLRDPAARQRYDNAGGPSPIPNERQAEPVRARVASAPPQWKVPERRSRRRKRRRFVTSPRAAGVLIVLMIAVGMLVISQSGSRPVLRANPDRIDKPVPKPSFLRGGSGSEIAVVQSTQMTGPSLGEGEQYKPAAHSSSTKLGDDVVEANNDDRDRDKGDAEELSVQQAQQQPAVGPSTSSSGEIPDRGDARQHGQLDGATIAAAPKASIPADNIRVEDTSPRNEWHAPLGRGASDMASTEELLLPAHIPASAMTVSTSADGFPESIFGKESAASSAEQYGATVAPVDGLRAGRGGLKALDDADPGIRFPLEERQSVEADEPATDFTGWVVQVASVSNRDDAELMLEQLRDTGFDGFVEKVEVVKVYYRVRVGPAADRQHAAKLQADIAESMQLDGQVCRILDVPSK